MNMELLIALGSCALSFLAFYLFFSLLNKILNVEMPDFTGFIIGLIIITAIYIKKDFFFAGNPLVTGITIGAVLSMFWNIKGAGFMGEVLRVVISPRFLMWCLAVSGGIYWDGIAAGLWNKYIASGISQVKLIIMLVVVILFILGTVLILFPEFYIMNVMKSTGFTLNRSVSTTKKVFAQIIGLVIIFFCSGLLSEIALYVNKLFS